MTEHTTGRCNPSAKAKPRRGTEDAAAATAATSGAATADAAKAYGAASPTFDRAEIVITNNERGGAGYFAKAHHTASLNVDAMHEGLSTQATRLGSTDFGSADIELDSGETYNPKYYSSAPYSYSAGAELLADGTAKYAGGNHRRRPYGTS